MIPRGETEWFETNRMGTRFSRNNRSNSVDDSDNVITLRSDLHTGFDQKLFAFAPKNKKMMVHCMDRDAADYHNLPLEANVCQEFLLARFAWTLYPICLAPWLKMKRPRLIWVDVNGSLQAKELSGEECQRIAHASKPRSTSPKKRKMEDIPVSSDSSKPYFSS